VGKIVATYLVKVTLREEHLLDAPPPGGDMFPPKEVAEPPTVESLGTFIGDSVSALLPGLTANATAERTDR
jgi:hypothetical protein